MTVLAMPRPQSAPRPDVHCGLRLQPHESEVHRAREFADAAAVRFGLSEDERYDFRLAASEAAANAIEHGLPCWDGAIHLWTTEAENTLTFGVRNAGEFVFKPPPTDPLAERGRGLTVISRLVDVVELSRVGDHVVIELVMRRSLGD
jgi:anti-sigma regulatory factor (Ser/Thr protein kinase)